MRPTTTVIVKHPLSGAFIALTPLEDYAADDVLVREYPWAFKPIENPGQVVESVRVERATAAPGEKRTLRRDR